ncbi:MAG: hypothetical protein ACYTG5_04855 [Planctomycetota bacterium]|jgi:hypothetical protein
MIRLKIAGALLAAFLATACSGPNYWSWPATKYNFTPEEDPEKRKIDWEDPDPNMGFYIAAWLTNFSFGLAADIAILPITATHDLFVDSGEEEDAEESEDG